MNNKCREHYMTRKLSDSLYVTVNLQSSRCGFVNFDVIVSLKKSVNLIQGRAKVTLPRI